MSWHHLEATFHLQAVRKEYDLKGTTTNFQTIALFVDELNAGQVIHPWCCYNCGAMTQFGPAGPRTVLQIFSKLVDFVR